jgi:prepilin-type processing-associated H-X9-DG protein
LGIAYESVEGQFGGSIGVTEAHNAGVKTSQINDPVKFLVCGDSQMPQMGGPYRDVWQVCGEYSGGCADWVNCSFSQQCGIDSKHLKQFWTDATFRSKYTRHLGGSNFGFADGHASWWNADAFMAEVPHQDCPCEGRPYHPGTIEGAGCYGYVVACPDW